LAGARDGEASFNEMETGFTLQLSVQNQAVSLSALKNYGVMIITSS
jgi:hypothetical protein